MPSGILLFLERIPLARGAESNELPWFRALTLPGDFVDELNKKGLAQVAFIRWLGATIMGTSDAHVYSSQECRGEPLSPATDLHLYSSERPAAYWIRVIRDDHYRALPIHPKDAQTKRLSSRPPGDTATWRGLDEDVDRALCLRDLNRCQASGANRTMQGDPLHRAHVIPRRRGPVILQRLFKARNPGVPTPVDFNPDSMWNLVSLSVFIHSAWEANVFCLVPFPNVAYDSHGRPLEYGGASDEADPASSFVSSELPLNPSAVAPATRQRPLVKIVRIPGQVGELPALGTSLSQQRLRGPFGLMEESPWPPEWIWSYRAAAQITARFGTDALRDELKRFWDIVYVDPRGSSSETGSSITASSTSSATDEDEDEGDEGDAGQNPDPFEACEEWLKGIDSAGGASKLEKPADEEGAPEPSQAFAA